MEQSSYVDTTLDVVSRLRKDVPRIGVALQAYLRRTNDDAARMIREGIGIRLVKGAYAEAPSVAFPDKAEVDANYVKVAKLMMAPESRANGFRAVYGTHDTVIINALERHGDANGIGKTDYEIHMLYGIQRGEQRRLAEQQVALQQTAMDDMVIRAPFSGVAISKDAQPGEMVSPVSAGGGFTRTGICTIVDMRSLEIEVDVNESYINRVKPAQGVTAVLDAYPDFEIPARVITTVPTADRQKATVLVRIAFLALDPRILPDMGVKVTFLRDADDTDAPAAQAISLVPKTAVKTVGDQSMVFVVRPDNTVERRAVRIGGTDGERQEVVAGLRAGERVVVVPPPAMVDGARVVVK